MALLVLLAALATPPVPVPPQLRADVVRLTADLDSSAPETVAAAEHQLLDLGSDASGALLAALHDASPARGGMIRALLPRFGPAAVARLYWTSARDLAYWRGAHDEAVRAVAAMGEPALPELRRLLETGWAAGFVADALGAMGDAGRNELHALAGHPQSRLRVAAMASLARHADARSARVFRAGAESKEAEVRLHAVRGLGALASPEFADVLAERLKDREPTVRAEAVAALTRNRSARQRTLLAGVARDDVKVSVRWAAAHALLAADGDPWAARLGRRYLPTTTADPEEGPPRLALMLRLTFAGLLVYLVAWLGARRQPEMPWAGDVPGAAAAMLAIGVYWGRFAVGLDGAFERLLLWVCVPAVAWVCWFAGPRLRVLSLPATGLGAVVLALALAPLAGFVLSVWAQARAPLWIAASLASALALAVWAGRGLDSIVLRRFRRAALVVLAAFYAGYALGWAALWAGSNA
jgi:HEAT repeat protein